MRVENLQHLLASFREELLSVARVGDGFPLLCIAARNPVNKFIQERPITNTNFSLMWRKLAFGISRTKIHRTLKTPFHLSEAQTLLLRV